MSTISNAGEISRVCACLKHRVSRHLILIRQIADSPGINVRRLTNSLECVWRCVSWRVILHFKLRLSMMKMTFSPLAPALKTRETSYANAVFPGSVRKVTAQV